MATRKKKEVSGLPGLLYYMKEREAIRLKKEAGAAWPWTADAILQRYKFTNVKRANDRTTKAFVAFYRRHYKRQDLLRNDWLLYNAAVARYFGTAEFQANVGWMKEHDKAHLVKTARQMRKRGTQVFTGAYIITSGGQSGPKESLVAKYLGGLWRAAELIVDAIYRYRSWEAGYNEMRHLPGFGGSGFMSKEVLQDFLLVTDIKVDDALTWTPMGPGARRGMNRLKGRQLGHRQHEDKFIEEVQELHRMLSPWWRDTYPDSGELSAHDVQFCLCELDKYERTRLGEGRPRSKYLPQSKEN